MVYSLPVSSFHGISKARTLEWVAISFSVGKVSVYESSLRQQFKIAVYEIESGCIMDKFLITVRLSNGFFQ